MAGGALVLRDGPNGGFWLLCGSCRFDSLWLALCSAVGVGGTLKMESIFVIHKTQSEDNNLDLNMSLMCVYRSLSLFK